MAFQDSRRGDIYANLAVSQDEARSGSSRVITLPGGQSITIRVPAGISDGEEIRLQGQGNPGDGGAGDLVLRIAVIKDDNPNSPFQDQRSWNGQTEQMGQPPPSSSPSAAQSYPDYRTGAASYTPPGDVTPYYAPTEAIDNPYLPGQTPGAPQPYTGYGPYPTYQEYNPQTYPPQYTPAPPQPSRRSGITAAVVTILVIVVLVGSGLAFYLGYYQPHQAQVAGTATAHAQATGTANSIATGTAQVVQGTANAISTSTAQVQATASAYQNIYTRSTSGAPVFSDSMNGQTGRQWDQLTSSVKGTCGFQGGSYHSQMPTPGFFQPCFAQNTNFSNFAFQVNMTLVKGNSGGILFRADHANNKYYLFRINTAGNYDLFLYVSNQASQVRTLLRGSTDLMKNGQVNTLTLVAQGSNFYFYINQQYMDSTSDGTYTAGQIGVFGDSSTQPTDASFSNIKVWTL